MLEWMTRDGKLIILSRMLRAFAYGFLSISIGVYLKTIGFSEFQIGVIVTASIFGGAVMTIATTYLAGRVGRRRLLLLLVAMMAISGGVFVSSTAFVVLLIATLVGTINVTGGELGAFLSLEQAIIPQTCALEKRNNAFALYNTGALFSAAAGGLLGFLPSILQDNFGVSASASFRVLLVLYTLFALSTFVPYLSLSRHAEVRSESGAPKAASLSPISKKRITELSVLLGLDAFGGGFFVQSIISYWFVAKFGAPLGLVSLGFSTYNLLGAISFLTSAKLANRIGQLRTMVYTHIPGSILLIILPFSPNFLTAMTLYVGSAFLSLMDVPARQSLVVSLVNPEERVAAAGFTNLSRNLSQVPSPTIAGYLLQSVSFVAPFLAGSGIEMVYDVILYIRFRGIAPQPTTVTDEA